MARTFTGIFSTLALLFLLALAPAPAVASYPRPDGIANTPQMTEFSSRHRRRHARRYERVPRLSTYPVYYRPYRRYDLPYQHYTRPYRYFGAPFEVALRRYY
jgi:hypothetical protein